MSHTSKTTHWFTCDVCKAACFNRSTRLYSTFLDQAIKAGWKVEGPAHIDTSKHKHTCPDCAAKGSK